MAKSEEKLTLSVSELHDLFEAWSAQKEAEEKEKSGFKETDPLFDEWMEEKVPIKLFRDGRDYRDDVFVSVNGYSVQIKRGETVMVPRKIALVLDAADRQNNDAADRQKSLSDSLMGIL